MGIIAWIKRAKVRRKARKEIKTAKKAAVDNRQGQRALARKIEKIRREESRRLDALTNR